MHNFFIVDGKKFIDYKPGKEAYARALSRLMKKVEEGFYENFMEIKETESDLFKKWFYCNLKYVSESFDFNKKYSTDEIQGWFSLTEIVNDMAGCLTPCEFIQMFPVMKEYDGEKYQSKDYFSTMEYISQFCNNKPIGCDEASEFLFEYQNRDIRNYMCVWMGVINRMNQSNGGKDIILEFFEETGTPLHTFHKEGDCVVDDESGERFEIQKPENKLKKLFSVI